MPHSIVGLQVGNLALVVEVISQPLKFLCRVLRPKVGATKLEPKWALTQPSAKMCLLRVALVPHTETVTRSLRNLDVPVGACADVTPVRLEPKRMKS